MTHAGTSNRTLVHIVDVDHDVQRLLTCWLVAAGIESRTYTHLRAFLDADRAEIPGCLIIDAQPNTICGLETHAILLPLAVDCPIVVTASPADVTLAAGVMKSRAVQLVEKPLHERQILTAVCSAIQLDRQRRLIANRHEEVRARFETLSRREREVMALVTAGTLNKQIGCALGVSEITVKAHRGAAMRKMRARSLAELVRMADALGDELAPPALPWLSPALRNDSSIPVRNAVGADRRSGYRLAPS